MRYVKIYDTISTTKELNKMARPETLRFRPWHSYSRFQFTSVHPPLYICTTFFRLLVFQEFLSPFLSEKFRCHPVLQKNTKSWKWQKIAAKSNIQLIIESLGKHRNVGKKIKILAKWRHFPKKMDDCKTKKCMSSIYTCIYTGAVILRRILQKAVRNTVRKKSEKK